MNFPGLNAYHFSMIFNRGISLLDGNRHSRTSRSRSGHYGVFTREWNRDRDRNRDRNHNNHGSHFSGMTKFVDFSCEQVD